MLSHLTAWESEAQGKLTCTGQHVPKLADEAYLIPKAEFLKCHFPSIPQFSAGPPVTSNP